MSSKLASSSSKLVLADIAELRAYERERPAFRDHVIALKKRRRVAIGPIVTLLFENRDTVRFQVQEMARAERLVSDDAIQTELDTYNALIPERGELSATMFLELTSEADLRSWLPRLVGIERSVEVAVGPASTGPAPLVVGAEPEAGHAAQLTREDITSSVHYIRWSFTASQIERFAGPEPISLAVRHPAYNHVAVLSPETRAEVLADVLGR